MSDSKNPKTNSDKTSVLIKPEAIDHSPKTSKKSNQSVLKSAPSESMESGPENMLNRVIQKRYKIEALVGHGGMCDVYRAKDLLLEAAGDSQPYVAIKLLQKEFHTQTDASRILLREARKTQQLSHPNIIKVHSFSSGREGFYLVMEWLDGQTLNEVIKSHRPNGLSYNNSMAILKQLLSALRYAHENGVVHADLKPGNIMLTRDGDLKIFDFGVSRALNLKYDKYAAEKPDDTSPVSGYTPTYASAELLAGNAPDKADDIYAVSCIAYELLSSKHPYHRKTAEQAIKDALTPVKPPHISLLHWPALKKGLQLDPHKRIKNIPELETGLTRSLGKYTLAAAILGCLAFAIFYALAEKEKTIQALHQQAEANTQSQAILMLPVDQFLPRVGSFKQDQKIAEQAWLRKYQADAIDHYEEQIDKHLNHRDLPYPDYPAIETILNKANTLYPDSSRLSLITEDIYQDWDSTVQLLSERLYNHLDDGHYQTSDDGDDIFTIYRDLIHVQPDFISRPGSKAKKLFARRFDTAATNIDTKNLASLIPIGETFFAGNETLKDRLTLATELKSAIQIMAQFREQRDSDETTPFPYKAATTLYQKRFESIQAQAIKAVNVKTLNKLEREVSKLSKQLPADFYALLTVRQIMADKYLKFSDIFLRRNQTKSANFVIKKAQDLMGLVQQGRTIPTS